MFNIFYADCIGREGNCLYPHRVDVTDAASLAQAVGHDYSQEIKSVKSLKPQSVALRL